MAGNWNEASITALRGYVECGDYSFAQIANLLNKLHGTGVSRNAAIGKSNRLGFSGPRRLSRSRSPVTNHTPKVARTPRNKIARPVPTTRPGGPPAPVVLREASLTPTATVETLERRACRWPIGDPQAEDFGFCGRDRGENPTYCAVHAPLAGKVYSLGGRKPEDLMRLASRYA